MAPLQAKMRAGMPNFTQVLNNLPGGLPDVHIAVVSTSLGAGTYANVPGCGPNTLGNLNGEFQHHATCTQLNAGASFISATRDATGARVDNFVGDINDLFSCMANLGDRGCGFEHPFEAARLALQRAVTVGDVNSGFLRPDAYLAVVMLANEDDCSVPADSRLFDPLQQSLSDPLGGSRSYRCNEFGHLCYGQPLPHVPPQSSPVPFFDCVSNENGPLVPVTGFTEFPVQPEAWTSGENLRGAIAGPPTPYVIEAVSSQLPNGATELQPAVQHSCTSSTGSEYADPAVRIRQATSAFGPNSLFVSICADDFGPVMTTMAQTIVGGP